MWIGLAVGIYGLTQAIFQIPFGVVSDRVGRRKAIVVGLSLFALGSFVAGEASSIWFLLAGRALQGAGAVASVLIAFAADLTRPVARTRAMAFLGGAIGVSFGVGFVVGPYASVRIGEPALFTITGVLTLLAIIWVLLWLPDLPTKEKARPITLAAAVDVLRRRELVLLNLGTMTVHLALTCMFVVVPIELDKALDRSWQWLVYLPVTATALMIMVFAARRADRPGWSRPVLRVGTTLLALACIALAVLPKTSLMTLSAGILLFTWGIAFCEPVLPALLTRYVPDDMRGTAAGVFNVHQFAGAFLGGLGGGLALSFGPRTMFVVLAVALLVWTLVSFYIPPPFRVERARRRRERKLNTPDDESQPVTP
jgi:MFS family permease